jgi:hypothetical protein
MLVCSYDWRVDASSNARTSADMVPTKAVANLMTSFESPLRCCSGNARRRPIPAAALPKINAKAIPATPMELNFASLVLSRVGDTLAGL